MKDFAIILSLNILPKNLDRPSQEHRELWVETAWMAYSISASVTPEFSRKPGKVHCFLCCTSEDEDEADGHCPWSKSVTVRLKTFLFFFAKYAIGSNFLEISLFLCFFPFEWLMITLLPISVISNVWWYSLQYTVHALGPFSTHSKLYQPVIIKCTVAFSHTNYFLKKRKINNNMGCGQNTQA